MAENLMHALQYNSYGGGAVALKHVEVPIPTPNKENLGTARLVVDFDRWWTGEESVNVLLEAAGQDNRIFFFYFPHLGMIMVALELRFSHRKRNTCPMPYFHLRTAKEILKLKAD
ncbi:uncharacterized protein LOC105774620 isoform X2 [Gossypium raimondii]|uniref:uncharacterized protein LOC105774620 isoform X2 n=1 Tax=Gossypium raimondii TaxID=29730 RepID=UPI00227A7E31|nr:uncharacterized protein LOC105774620 isoform X2 [Gossypium raimondii]